MRVGIGITSYNRPECLKECLEHISKHTFTNNVKIYVATDTDEDRRGVAFRKNECLRSLKNCDYIFLFDDVAIYKPEDIEHLIDNLTEEQAKFMLIRAVQMAYKNGLYSLTESEIVSKSLRTLK